MGLFKKMTGAILDAADKLFQFGINGPQIKAESTDEAHFRNADNSGYARVKGAAPIDDEDFVTKYYADSLSKPIIISDQVDTSTAIPSNTGVRRFLVVTTAGNGAVIGGLLYDDGSGVGTMSIIPPLEGRTIAVTDTLSGGTISFEADSIYIWDADGGSWLKIGDVGNVSGAQRVIRMPITNAASQDSTSEIPANAIVTNAVLDITVAYSAGATISIGRTGALDLLQLTTDNNPELDCSYEVQKNTSWGGAADNVTVTVGGAPAAGAGFVTVFYTIPNN